MIDAADLPSFPVHADTVGNAATTNFDAARKATGNGPVIAPCLWRATELAFGQGLPARLLPPHFACGEDRYMALGICIDW